MIATLETAAGVAEVTVSATKLNTWLGCRLRYWFKYGLRLKTPRTPALHVGQTVHAVLKRWHQARWRRETVTREQLRAAYDDAWLAGQQPEGVTWGEAGEEAEEKTQGWELLTTCFEQSPIPPEERPEGVEVTVEADLSNRGLPKLMGVLDLVRANGVIVDYKTAAQTPKPDRAFHSHEVQLSIYSLLYREATGRQEGGRELHHLIKLKRPKFIVTSQGPMTGKEETRLCKQLESFLNGIGRADYVPSPGMQCMACPYQTACRDWS